jgi:hypothetical protein
MGKPSVRSRAIHHPVRGVRVSAARPQARHLWSVETEDRRSLPIGDVTEDGTVAPLALPEEPPPAYSGPPDEPPDPDPDLK